MFITEGMNFANKLKRGKTYIIIYKEVDNRLFLEVIRFFVKICRGVIYEVSIS